MNTSPWPHWVDITCWAIYGLITAATLASLPLEFFSPPAAKDCLIFVLAGFAVGLALRALTEESLVTDGSAPTPPISPGPPA